MKTIATLTLNPTIDVSYDVEKVFHTHKMRTLRESYAPGGGGINVARVFNRLGGEAHAFYMAGGATGPSVDGLLAEHALNRTCIPIAGNSRVSVAAFDRSSGKEYRLVPAGPTVTQPEWEACLDRLTHSTADYLVLSGSLPPGVPEDFYARIVQAARPRGIQVVLDTSGAALKATLEGGGIYLVKPSSGELAQFAGHPLESDEAIAAAAMDIVTRGLAELVAVTMGHEGALLAQKSGTVKLPAVPIEAKSAVGAGDSFAAGMVYGLAKGWNALDAFRYGIAAGSAAVLTPGADLCHREDVERLFPLVGRG